MRPSGFEPLASSSGGFLSGPTCTDIRGTTRFFRPRRGTGEPCDGRCVTQSVPGEALGPGWRRRRLTAQLPDSDCELLGGGGAQNPMIVRDELLQGFPQADLKDKRPG